MASSSSAQQKQMPKDAIVITSILKELGITDYEPRVVNQLLEFMYRYTTSVLEDAKVYSNHAKKKAIDLDDVRLAVQMRLDKNFTSPPSRDILLEIARTKNSSPLPFVKPHCGIRLPPDRYCLNSCNYRLKSIAPKKLKCRLQVLESMNEFSHSSLSGGYGSKMGLGKGPGVGSGLMGKRAGGLSTVPRTQAMSTPKPVIKFSSAGFGGGAMQSKMQISGMGLGGTQIKVESEEETSLKRKREPDDFGSMDTN